MLNPFGSIHYNAIGPFLRKELGTSIAKLSIDGGFTCPNRDGSKGLGGCIFCSDGGSSYKPDHIKSQVLQLSKKWPESKYIAYFQSYTNTYAPIYVLKKKYDEALSHPGVVGLAIATRPDCLGDDVIELLKEYNRHTYLWVELGLQTINDYTAKAFNRGYDLDVFNCAMATLKNCGIKTVVHLIFGLPGENRDNMLASAEYVGGLLPFGVKFHHLFLTEASRMAKDIEKISFLEMKEYIGIIVDAMEILHPSITIHRLGGDPPKKGLLGPLWSLDKRAFLNEVQKEFKSRQSYQGWAIEK